MNANADQAMPKEVTDASGAAVWDVILADSELPEWLRVDIEARDQIGVERYGQRLRVHNGRDALLDAYQEAKDLWVYLKQCELRALSKLGGDRSAANQLLVGGLTSQVKIIRATVLWLGQLVQAGIGKELT